MYKFTVFIEKEWKFFVAHNLELWIASQWLSYDESIKNLKESTILYLEDENKESVLNKFQDRNYSLTTMMV